MVLEVNNMAIEHEKNQKKIRNLEGEVRGVRKKRTEVRDVFVVGVCGCLWVFVGVCGCLWVFVGVFVVGVCRCLWVFVGVCEEDED